MLFPLAKSPNEGERSRFVLERNGPKALVSLTPVFGRHQANT